MASRRLGVMLTRSRACTRPRKPIAAKRLPLKQATRRWPLGCDSYVMIRLKLGHMRDAAHFNAQPMQTDK